MGTFGWVLIAGAFLVLIMVANNSWAWVWAKISRGMPQPGEGNRIVPTPPESTTPFEIPPGTFPPTPEGVTGEGNAIVQSAPAGTPFNPYP